MAHCRKEKLEILGPRHVVLTKADSDADEGDEVIVADSGAVESVFSQGMLPLETYQEVLHSMAAMGVIDASPAQGEMLKACLTMRRPCFAICGTECHSKKLEILMTEFVLEEMGRQGSTFYQPDMEKKDDEKDDEGKGGEEDGEETSKPKKKEDAEAKAKAKAKGKAKAKAGNGKTEGDEEKVAKKRKADAEKDADSKPKKKKKSSAKKNADEDGDEDEEEGSDSSMPWWGAYCWLTLLRPASRQTEKPPMGKRFPASRRTEKPSNHMGEKVRGSFEFRHKLDKDVLPPFLRAVVCKLASLIWWEKDVGFEFVPVWPKPIYLMQARASKLI